MNRTAAPQYVPSNREGLAHLYDFTYETRDSCYKLETDPWLGPLHLSLWENSEDLARARFDKVFRACFGTTLSYRITAIKERGDAEGA